MIIFPFTGKRIQALIMAKCFYGLIWRKQSRKMFFRGCNECNDTGTNV